MKVGDTVKVRQDCSLRRVRGNKYKVTAVDLAANTVLVQLDSEDEVAFFTHELDVINDK